MENYNQIFERIEELLLKKDTILIAIDGRCASGKSTLAKEIAAKYGGNVFHIDDFYIPFKDRKNDFQNIIGGNIDLNRFTESILGKITNKKKFTYSKYSCQFDKFENVEVEPHRINIIEGAYTNLLKAEFDLKIFLDVKPDTQLERIKERNGEQSKENFVNIWIPLEERYIKATELTKVCDLLVDTSNFW